MATQNYVQMENNRYNKINQLFELHKFLSVIERDDKGIPVKVSGAFEESPNRTRLAENNYDFEEILKNELVKANITDENNLFFIDEVKGLVNGMIATYKENHSNQNRDITLLTIANSFISFLDEKLNLNEKKASIEVLKNNTLQWYGTQSELIELTKALIENGNLKGKQKDIFEKIQKIFNVKLNHIDQAITKFNSRNQENDTKFLDTLKASLTNYIKAK